MEIEGLLKIGSQLINRFFPDKAKQDEAKLKLLEMQQNGELAQLAADLELAKGQMEINLEEAKSPSLFKSGWRPAVGWLCVFALAYQFIIRPLAIWGSQFYGFEGPPALDLNTLMTLLFGLLGLGGMRTAEKFKGVAAK